MKGAKREELDKLINQYGGRCVDFGRKEGTSFDLNNAREAITLFLDSLTVLEISAEEWAEHPGAIGIDCMFTRSPESAYEGHDHFAYIPRPAAPRLTDAEIEERAIKEALRISTPIGEAVSFTPHGVELAIKLAFAEKSRLDAERGA